MRNGGVIPRPCRKSIVVWRGWQVAGGHGRCAGLALVSLLIMPQAAEAESLAAVVLGQLPPVTVTSPETRPQKRVRQPRRERSAPNLAAVLPSQPASAASGVTSGSATSGSSNLQPPAAS